MRTSIARLIAVFGLLIGALAFGTAASAADTNPNGATVVNINQCETDPYTGGQFCITEKAVFQNAGYPTATNPAGNSSTTVNGRLCVTETDATGAVVYQYCEKAHEHLLVKDGTQQEGHLYDSYTSVTPYGTFCVTINFHTANGQVQYDNTSFTC